MYRIVFDKEDRTEKHFTANQKADVKMVTLQTKLKVNCLMAKRNLETIRRKKTVAVFFQKKYQRLATWKFFFFSEFFLSIISFLQVAFWIDSAH